MSDEPLQRSAEDESRTGAAPTDSGETAELIARLRHEINNPLTGLIGQSQLLLRDAGLSEDARRRIQTIEQLAKRIRDTVAALPAEQPRRAVTATEAAGSPREGASAEDPPRH